MAKFGNDDKHPQLCVAGMVIIRLFLGAFFLIQGVQFMAKSSNFPLMIENATAGGGNFTMWSGWPAFSKFLVQTVHPHADTYAWLIIIISLLAGVMLLLGLLTRLAAFMTMLVSIFFLLATWTAPTPNFAFHAALLCMELAVLVAAAGRTFGIDRKIARKTKVKILW